MRETATCVYVVQERHMLVRRQPEVEGVHIVKHRYDSTRPIKERACVCDNRPSHWMRVALKRLKKGMFCSLLAVP